MSVLGFDYSSVSLIQPFESEYKYFPAAVAWALVLKFLSNANVEF